MGSQTRLDQSLIVLRERRIVQFEHSAQQKLTFFEREGRQRFKTLRYAHGESVAIDSIHFNALAR